MKSKLIFIAHEYKWNFEKEEFERVSDETNELKGRENETA